MVTVIKKSLADYAEQAWKNGQGRTLEIARDSQEPFRWRVSSATLPTESDFSVFPNYDRQFILLAGGPVTFTQGAKTRFINPLQLFKFPGESATHAAIPETSQDFNLFVERDKARGNIYPSFCGKNEELQYPLIGSEHFIFVVEGELEVLEANTNQKYSLASRETLHLSRPNAKEYLNVRAKGKAATSCLWVVIHLL